MAYPPAPQYPQSPPPGPRTRPGSVTAVVWTHFVTAALLVFTGIGMFAVQGAVSDVLLEEMQKDPNFEASGYTESDISNAVTIGLVAVAAVFVVYAVFYVVLGALNNAGKRPARILSWILAGLSLLCCGPYTMMSQIGSTMSVNSGDPMQDEMAQSLTDATPGWLNGLSWALAIVLILGSLLIIILLALPASNRFFRKEESPMGPYPGQPPYGQPGQPGPGQPGPGQPPYGQGPPAP